MQVPKAEPQTWSTFLSSLQASQQPAVHKWAADEPVDHDWAGTVYWNGVWDKALDAEAKVVQERQQAVLKEEASAPSQPAAAPTAGVKIEASPACYACCWQPSPGLQLTTPLHSHCPLCKTGMSALGLHGCINSNWMPLWFKEL